MERGGKPLPSARFLLIRLGIVSAIAELAYGIMNQSAIPPYVQEIGLTAHIGLIYAAFLAVETATKSPMGMLGDRIGRRVVIAGGALLSSVVALCMTVTTKLWMLLVLRAIDGVGAAAIWPTMVAAASSGVERGKRTTAMSVLTVSYIAGLALGPLIGGLVNDSSGSRLASFYLVSGLLLFAAVAAVMWVPSSVEGGADCASGEPGRVRFRDVALALRTMPGMMAMAFTAFFAIGLLIPIVKLFAMNVLGMTETEYGGLFFPIAVVVAVVCVISGRLGDRWGAPSFVRVGLGVCMVSMWAICFVKKPWELACAATCLGLGFALAMPAWLATVSGMAAPHLRGSVIGVLGTAQGVGAILGAFIGSILYEGGRVSIWGLVLSSRHSPFAVSAAALTLCFMLALWFIRGSGEGCIGEPCSGDVRPVGTAE